MATGTTVCACPPDHAGRLCNIGESLDFRAAWPRVLRPRLTTHRAARSAGPALLCGEWHRVPRRGQHGGLGPQLPGLELRPALPGAARGLCGRRGPPRPGAPRLLPVSTGRAGPVPGSPLGLGGCVARGAQGQGLEPPAEGAKGCGVGVGRVPGAAPS